MGYLIAVSSCVFGANSTHSPCHRENSATWCLDGIQQWLSPSRGLVNARFCSFYDLWKRTREERKRGKEGGREGGSEKPTQQNKAKRHYNERLLNSILKINNNFKFLQNVISKLSSPLSEISQSQKDKSCVVPLPCSIYNSQIQKSNNGMMVIRGRGEGNGELLSKGHKVPIKQEWF